MFKIGMVQKAYINRFSNYGAFLSDEPNGEEEILLPNKFVKKEMSVDDELTVFIYRDSEKRLTATTQKPYITLNHIERLEVVGKIDAGYFMAFGLDKDLFLPYSEAKYELTTGQSYFVKMLLDEENQLIASMKIYDTLTTHHSYKTGDNVQGIIYDIRDNMGAFVAIDDSYHGFIPWHECFGDIEVGKRLTFRVTKIREDNKLNLSSREKAAVQIHDDVDVVLNHLNENEGFLLLNDKSDPEKVIEMLNMSKRAFKRAVGKLLKEEKIIFEGEGIRLKTSK